MNLRMNANESHSASNDDSLSNDTRENGPNEQPVYAFTEVASLKSDAKIFEPQTQFGRPYHPDDVMIFNMCVGDPENVAYLIDLYTYSSRMAVADTDEPPSHLGYHYVLPNVLRHSEGRIEIPITCATRHRPLGMMNMDYIRVSILHIPVFEVSIIISLQIVCFQLSPGYTAQFIGSIDHASILLPLLEQTAQGLGCWSSWHWL